MRSLFAIALAATTLIPLSIPLPPAPALDWRPCARQSPAECATVAVPVDWHRPDGPKMSLAVARRAATDPDARIGVLLFNPGGPGSSPAQDLRDQDYYENFSPDIRKRFDIVGFDQRGTGEAYAVTCDGDLLGQQPPTVPADAGQYAKLLAYNEKLTDNCRRLSGPVFDQADTMTAARDMDAVRAALGVPTVSFLGTSYGTLLGQQYAELFPHRIRTFVLDSNMDHSLDGWGFLRSQTVAGEDAFQFFLQWCDKSSTCALHGQDVGRIFQSLYDKAVAGTLTDPMHEGEKVAPDDLSNAAYYADYEPNFLYLAEWLKALDTGRPPRTAPSEPTGPGGWGAPTFHPDEAIFCADWQLTVSGFDQLTGWRAELARVASHIRRSTVAWGSLVNCLGAGIAVRNPQHALRVADAPPILLVAARHDPHTPYDWTVAVHRRISRSVLLTYDGSAHGNYGPDNPCVTAAVDHYLLSLAAPADGTRCPDIGPDAG
ncbi:alpha/beta hydrolase [Fodinicola acaciae]|uniref:alpha/beta hydrolase n=1 Tax=Fodinicola acaciae TaxID=2681555 RepID=UPI0013D2AC82|nr:alpha/beta hydrolase [Fodinicola acaciae]